MPPLEGVRVLDFCWVAAGPFLTRYLADFGATVLKVESRGRLDTIRISPPFKDGVSGVNRSGSFAYWNAGKWSITLNMKNPRGLALARRLILEWADVVTENFTAGVMERWGLGYEQLSPQRPDLIMLSFSTFGRRNPLSAFPGYGPLLTPFGGFNHLTGWPDREPVHPGPFGAYTDFVVPRLGALAVVSALDYRARTGRGLHIDLSQFESALHFLAPLLLEALETGRERVREGNRDPAMAPHGVYPCRDEEWVAIAVRTDEEWRALCRVMGTPSLAEDPRFATLPARKAREEDLDALVAGWTRDRRADEVMEALQREGIPAGAVRANRGLFHDPHLQARRFLVEVEHPEIGRHHLDRPDILLSRTPARTDRSSPLLGEHTHRVLREVLGLSEGEIEALEQEGALQ